MSGTSISNSLARWNRLSRADAAKEIMPCCGSTAWADGVAGCRPLPDEATLLAASDKTWRNLTEEDRMEAFRSHPRIGESTVSGAAGVRSMAWSKQEQQNVTAASNESKNDLAEANKNYEARFNRTFIVCATGKSAQELLEILRRRLRNDDETEFREAAEQQRLITHIRLKKWLAQ
jgi:2-oxo-4-hydroxy-4-carboxy-5-ureidoimidazoline decarboxylase